MKPYLAFVLLVLSFRPALSAGQTVRTPYPCAPSPAVLEALSTLPDMSDYRVPYEERMKPLRALLAKYPRDMFVQQRLADLKGKATFIDVWAVWCGACRAHHPKIQQLYNRLKGRQDIQVLSVSWDDNAYLAAAYMKEMKYSFPVIASRDTAEKLFPAFGLPAYWIIDARGRRSSPY